MNEEIYIGIDLGGTSIKMGMVNNQGKLLQEIEMPTPVKEGYQKVMETFEEMVKLLLKKSKYEWTDIQGVGVGIPGFIDIETGSVVEAVNLNWHNVAIKELLETKWGIPVEVENDANAASLGEMWVGAGQGASHILCLTIGTGIGGGIIINGDIYHGGVGMAGEIGHFVVRDEGGKRCNCGKIGCLETEVSATAMVNQALENISEQSSTRLGGVYERTGKITAKTIVELAREEDPFCQKIITQAGELLGKTLSKFSVLINPETIIIGGGVSYADDLLLKPLIETFQNYALPRIADNTKIVRAQVGNKAGMIGAAWNVRKHRF